MGKGPSGKGRWLEYDALHRRLWIGGQRCHHGAAGGVVTVLACVGLLAGQTRPAPGVPRPPRAFVALALAGGTLMAHDWKDHSVWFARGRGVS